MGSEPQIQDAPGFIPSPTQLRPSKLCCEIIYKHIKPHAHCFKGQGGRHLYFYLHCQQESELKANVDSWSSVLVSRKRKQKGLVGKQRNQWREKEEPKDWDFKMKGK